MKGIFKLRPSLPRYMVTYDVNIVLNYLKSFPPIPAIQLKELTFKVTTLLCLLSGQRCQTIHALKLDFMHKEKDRIVFYIPTILKTTTPTFHTAPLEFLAYEEDHSVCIVRHLNYYISLTEPLREANTLLISYAKPHKAVSSSTVGRYVKTVLKDSGIDTTIFSAHSTRSATTSKTNLKGLSLKDIEKAAGWKNCKTFALFYKKPIVNNFGDTLLS